MNKRRIIFNNSVIYFTNRLLIALLFETVLVTPSYSSFDTKKYLQSQPASITQDIFYPDFYRETDPVTFGNIYNEFKSRYEFFFGITTESRQSSCFQAQKRANRALARIKKREGAIKYKWIDNELLFNEESPLYQSANKRLAKADEKCRFVSYGDLNTSGGVFCAYHGPDPESEFYSNHIHEFTSARPFLTAYDITEVLIFLPFLMVLPISWLIMKKFI